MRENPSSQSFCANKTSQIPKSPENSARHLKVIQPQFVPRSLVLFHRFFVSQFSHFFHSSNHSYFRFTFTCQHHQKESKRKTLKIRWRMMFKSLNLHQSHQQAPKKQKLNHKTKMKKKTRVLKIHKSKMILMKTSFHIIHHLVLSLIEIQKGFDIVFGD